MKTPATEQLARARGAACTCGRARPGVHGPHVAGCPASPRVLVCDDSQIICDLAEYALTAAGFQVATRSTAIGLSGVVRATRPDLVVLDVEMPAITGPEACARIRRASPATLIVLFSSVARLEELSRTCAADAWLPKGLGVDALVAKARQMTKGCRA